MLDLLEVLFAVLEGLAETLELAELVARGARRGARRLRRLPTVRELSNEALARRLAAAEERRYIAAPSPDAPGERWCVFDLRGVTYSDDAYAGERLAWRAADRLEAGSRRASGT